MTFNDPKTALHMGKESCISQQAELVQCVCDQEEPPLCRSTLKKTHREDLHADAQICTAELKSVKGQQCLHHQRQE